MLNEFDMFNDAITQRSEHDNGPWLSGLDVVAADALALPGRYYELPPLICYLDRGPGAAIRRARTRLPGGHRNPVAIIRVPRERMIGSGIAGSLIHEVGHQAAALLDLVASLRVVLRGLQRGGGQDRDLWAIWERWISEIVADFWSVARVGIAATTGPDRRRQPAAAVRVPPQSGRSASDAVAAGEAEHGDGAGAVSRIGNGASRRRLWEELYPPVGLDDRLLALLRRLEAQMPAFVALLVNHRPVRLRGRSLPEVMRTVMHTPERLGALFTSWLSDPAAMYRARPTIVFAALGQASRGSAAEPGGRKRARGQAADLLGAEDNARHELRVRRERHPHRATPASRRLESPSATGLTIH